MQLTNLVDQLAIKPHRRMGSQALPSLTLAGVASDSRQVKPGYLFVATSPRPDALLLHVKDAVTRGAVAVIMPEESLSESQIVPLIEACVTVAVTPHPREILAQLASRLFPAQPKTIVAVTGTNGKSSVASFCRQLWTLSGVRAANLGTLGLEAPGLVSVPHPSFPLTTPDPLGLHRYLSVLVDHDVNHLAMEASSHGLDQHRLDGVILSAAAFTNLSQDHLDYHGDMERYFQAKLRLFSELLPAGAVAVLNRDCQEFGRLHPVCRARNHRILTYSAAQDADVAILSIVPTPQGQEVAIKIFDTTYCVKVPLYGAFQVMNIAAAIGLYLATGGNIEELLSSGELPLSGVMGRLQHAVTLPNGVIAFVDYAHTPDALRTVLTSLRQTAGSGRLLVVFGCGGDRDASKRPIMGRIASELADVAVITDDNPRTESPEKIRASILSGCVAGALILEIADRTDAIARAFQEAKPGDVIVVAGKGHEAGQIVAHEVHPFDDAAVVRDQAQRFFRVG